MGDLISIGIDAKHSFEDKIEPVWKAKERYVINLRYFGGVDVNKLASLPLSDLRKYVR